MLLSTSCGELAVHCPAILLKLPEKGRHGHMHTLRSLPRVFSQKFLQQLKTTLLDRAGAGSVSE